MRVIFYDTEANGLLEDVSRLHCLSYKELNGDIKTVTENYQDLFQDGDVWIAHNQFSYDLPLLVKLGIIKDFTPTTITLMDDTVKDVQLIDSLALSREMWPDMPGGHSLKNWAERLNGYKMPVEDWENQPIEVYIERCESDVELTEQVFKYLAEKLEIVYE